MIEKLTLEGDFFSLTKTLSELNHSKGIAAVRSFGYHLSKAKDGALFVDVYLEIVK